MLLFVYYYITPLLHIKKKIKLTCITYARRSGIEWLVSNKRVYKFHQSERVTDSVTRPGRACQPSLPVNSVEGGGLLHTSCFFLLCWHNRNYVPIWTHLNDSVNCELLIRTLIIDHFKLCAFWKFVCFCKLWIYSNRIYYSNNQNEEIQICTL